MVPVLLDTLQVLELDSRLALVLLENTVSQLGGSVLEFHMITFDVHSHAVTLLKSGRFNMDCLLFCVRMELGFFCKEDLQTAPLVIQITPFLEGAIPNLQLGRFTQNNLFQQLFLNGAILERNDNIVISIDNNSMMESEKDTIHKMGKNLDILPVIDNLDSNLARELLRSIELEEGAILDESTVFKDNGFCLLVLVKVRITIVFNNLNQTR